MQTNNETQGNGSAAKAGPKYHRMGNLTKNYMGYVMVAPFIIAFLVFGLYPIGNTIWLSFTNTTLMKQSGEFIGIKNFQALFADKFFYMALGNTWKIWLMNFIPQMAIALMLSAWFTSSHLKLKGIGFFRTVFFLPNLLLPATVAVLYFSLFNFYGPANQFLVRAGIFSEAFQFFRNTSFTQGLVAFIQTWMWFGNTLIILIAGMTSISTALYESAMIDGAGGWKMFTRITLPSLRPVLIYTLVTSLVGGLQMFDIPYMLTDGKGSPNNSILTLNVLMYSKFSSSKGHIGLAAAVGMCILLMTTVCSLLIFYVLRDKDAAKEKKEHKKMKKEQMNYRKAVSQ